MVRFMPGSELILASPIYYNDTKNNNFNHDCEITPSTLTAFLTKLQLCVVGFGLLPQLQNITQSLGGVARTQPNK